MFRKQVRVVNNMCVMNIKSVKYPKQLYNYVYMYFNHSGCKSFKLVLEPQTNGNILVVMYGVLVYITTMILQTL